jgi:hypothetical protein
VGVPLRVGVGVWVDVLVGDVADCSAATADGGMRTAFPAELLLEELLEPEGADLARVDVDAATFSPANRLLGLAAASSSGGRATSCAWGVSAVSFGGAAGGGTTRAWERSVGSGEVIAPVWAWGASLTTPRLSAIGSRMMNATRPAPIRIRAQVGVSHRPRLCTMAPRLWDQWAWWGCVRRRPRGIFTVPGDASPTPLWPLCRTSRWARGPRPTGCSPRSATSQRRGLARIAAEGRATDTMGHRLGKCCAISGTSVAFPGMTCAFAGHFLGAPERSTCSSTRRDAGPPAVGPPKRVT